VDSSRASPLPQQHFSLKHFADDIVGFVARQPHTLQQRIRDVFIWPGADAAATQQAHSQTHQVRVLGVIAVVARVVLEAQRGGQLSGHVPVAHQPRADLFTADAQQVLLDVAVAQVRVDLQVAADQREVRREDVGAGQAKYKQLAFMTGIQDKSIQIKGNPALVIWFQGLTKYLKPRKKPSNVR
jgi:hypothetical protein